jgi:ribonuclease HII
MKLPDFSFEKKLIKEGYRFVAGVDEVGRGCFAGPVVAGCVVFSVDGVLPEVKIDDSKKLTPKQRELSDKWIRKNAQAWGIGEASVAQINRLGIKKATERAFRKAIRSAGEVDYLLIDAFYIPFVKGLRRKNQKAIIKGDTRSISIASASIIAKVHRDRLMRKLGREAKFRIYKWGKNKGYGTKDHQTAIKKYGSTKYHRKLWIETWLSKSSFFQSQ